MLESIVSAFVKTGGPMGAALAAVVWYLVRRQGDMDRLQTEKQKLTEQLASQQIDSIQRMSAERQIAIDKAYHERLADQEAFRNTLLELNRSLVSALTQSTLAAEAMAETLDSIRDRLDDVYRLVNAPSEPPRSRTR
jgi:hypothetical protein